MTVNSDSFLCDMGLRWVGEVEVSGWRCGIEGVFMTWEVCVRGQVEVQYRRWVRLTLLTGVLEVGQPTVSCPGPLSCQSSAAYRRTHPQRSCLRRAQYSRANCASACALGHGLRCDRMWHHSCKNRNEDVIHVPKNRTDYIGHAKSIHVQCTHILR